MITRILFFSAVLACALCTRTSTVVQQFTNGIRNCRTNHAERINVCLMREIKRMQPHLPGGLPELGIPRLEPLLLSNVEFKQSEPPVTIHAIYQNVLVSGISDFDIKYLDIEYGTVRKMALGMTIPSLTMRGHYKMGGNIFLLPIEGEGPFVSVIDGVIAEGTADIVPRGNGYQMENVNIGFKIRSMKSELKNLFQGNQILSDTVHHFLNENGQLVMDEVRSGINDKLNGFIAKLFNGMFKILPLDIFENVPGANSALQSGNRRPVINTSNMNPAAGNTQNINPAANVNRNPNPAGVRRSE